jgi:hypothetical protein
LEILAGESDVAVRDTIVASMVFAAMLGENHYQKNREVRLREKQLRSMRSFLNR